MLQNWNEAERFMAKKVSRRKPGKTAITPGGLRKKQIYLAEAEWQALRQRAFDEERSHSEIVREALRRYLGIKG